MCVLCSKLLVEKLNKLVKEWKTNLSIVKETTKNKSFTANAIKKASNVFTAEVYFYLWTQILCILLQNNE